MRRFYLKYPKQQTLSVKLSRSHYCDLLSIENDDERDIVLSNIKNKDETDNYIETLRNFYNIKETTIQADSFDLTKFNTDDIIQIIPQEKVLSLKKINSLFYRLKFDNY